MHKGNPGVLSLTDLQWPSDTLVLAVPSEHDPNLCFLTRGAKNFLKCSLFASAEVKILDSCDDCTFEVDMEMLPLSSHKYGNMLEEGQWLSAGCILDCLSIMLKEYAVVSKSSVGLTSNPDWVIADGIRTYETVPPQIIVASITCFPCPDSEVSCVVLPFQPCAGHWGLIVAKIVDKTLFYFDSLTATPDTSTLVRAVNHLESNGFGSTDTSQKWTAFVEQDTQQENDSDCGVFVLMNCLMFLRRMCQLPFSKLTQHDMTGARDYLKQIFIGGDRCGCFGHSLGLLAALRTQKEFDFTEVSISENNVED